ncbi:MAG: transketolase C-terminal domain-containing protein, partial [Candidatus Woesearchaeota archaeon]
AEANMIGLAAGLAREGKIPFCASFTCFASRRVYDQITISVAYANTNVKIVGTAPGITQGPNGGTHMDFLDLAIMRAMPNIHVYSPCDVYELRAVMKYMATHYQPTYMQLLRPKMPVIFNESFEFNPAKASILTEGIDVTIVTTGYTTHLAVKAVEQLRKEGINAEVVDLRTIRPLDTETLIASVKKTNRAVVVDESWPFTSIASEVSFQLQRYAFDYLDAPVVRVCGADSSMHYAPNLVEAYLPSVSKVVQAVKAVCYKS